MTWLCWLMHHWHTEYYCYNRKAKLINSYAVRGWLCHDIYIGAHYVYEYVCCRCGKTTWK